MKPRAWPAAAALLGLVAACDRTPPTAPPRTLVVFATLYPLADLARRVGGERVRVDWLLDLGDPITDYALSRRDRERMTGVDLVLCDGIGRTETWAREEIGRLGETGTVVGVSGTPGASDVPANGLLYLDPVLAAAYARELADAMARRTPSEGDGFRARADAMAKEIEATAATFVRGPGAGVMVLSGLFAPLLGRCGVPSTLYEADYLNLSPADAEAVRRAAENAGVRTLIVPFDTPPGTLANLQERTGLKPFALDPLGYPNFPQHSTYLDVLKFNLEQLKLATAG